MALDGAISSTTDYAVNALIILDQFHATQKASEALNQVRRDELNNARKNKNGELIALTNCKQRFILLKNRNKLSDKQAATLQRLCEINQPIYKAILLKKVLLASIILKMRMKPLVIYTTKLCSVDYRPLLRLPGAWVDKIEYVLN